MKKIILTAPLVLALSACASHTKDISPQYVSPMEFRSYSCGQIEQELSAVSRKVSEVGAVVDQQASTDSVQTGVGIVLFWPTLFFLDGDTPQAAEYARLRGEFDALEKAGRQKNCGIHVTPLAPRAVKVEKPAKQRSSAQGDYN